MKRLVVYALISTMLLSNTIYGNTISGENSQDTVITDDSFVPEQDDQLIDTSDEDVVTEDDQNEDNFDDSKTEADEAQQPTEEVAQAEDDVAIISLLADDVISDTATVDFNNRIFTSGNIDVVAELHGQIMRDVLGTIPTDKPTTADPTAIAGLKNLVITNSAAVGTGTTLSAAQQKEINKYRNLETFELSGLASFNSNTVRSGVFGDYYTPSNAMVNLKSVKMPSITSVINAFGYCRKLETIEVGPLTSVGACAFAYLDSLKEINLRNARFAPIFTEADDDPADSWFEGTNHKAITLYVPKYKIDDEVYPNDEERVNRLFSQANYFKDMNILFNNDIVESDPTYDSPTVELTIDSFTTGSLNQAIKTAALAQGIDLGIRTGASNTSTGNPTNVKEIAKIKSITITGGILSKNDALCLGKFFQLEDLSIIGTATFNETYTISPGIDGQPDFIPGQASGHDKNSLNYVCIPSSAFEKHPSLKNVKIDNVEIVNNKAFSEVSTLETLDLPNVVQINPQSFAMTKFSDNSQMKIIKLPKLEIMWHRTFYYNVRLEHLELGHIPPIVTRPPGKEGLWFNYVRDVTIDVPDYEAYEKYISADYVTEIDWSVFNFNILNPKDTDPELKPPVYAPEYKDSEYNKYRHKMSGDYYVKELYPISLNFYSFNQPLNRAKTAADKNGGNWLPSNETDITTPDLIRWAKDNGFDAVDITFYYIPGYTNIGMPDAATQALIRRHCEELRDLCEELGIRISGTGIQNSFSDNSASRVAEDVERTKFYLEMSELMGSPCMRIFTGTAPVDAKRKGWLAIMNERVFPAIEEVLEYGKENGINCKIGIQNHGDMLSTANQVLFTMHHLRDELGYDNVGIVNDTGYYREYGNVAYPLASTVYNEIARVLPATINFQLKKKPRGAESGNAPEDMMDLTQIFRMIRSSDFGSGNAKDLTGGNGFIPCEVLWATNDFDNPEKDAKSIGILEDYKEQVIAFKKKVDAANLATKNMTKEQGFIRWEGAVIEGEEEQEKPTPTPPVGDKNKPGSSSSRPVTYTQNISKDLMDKINSTDNKVSVSLTGNSATLTGESLNKVGQAQKDIQIISKDGTSITFTPSVVSELKVKGSDNVTIVIKSFSPVLNVEKGSTNESLLKLSRSVTLTVNNKTVTSFKTPLKLTFPISAKLNDGQKEMMTGVRFMADGKTVNRLGGEFNTKGEFEFYTKSLSNYGVMVSDKLTKIKLTIGNNDLTINGETKRSDVAPIIMNDRTMLPLRVLAEALGAEVGWDDNTKTVTMVLDGKTINLKIGDPSISTEGACVILNERTMAPVSYVSVLFGANVLWDDNTKSVTIYN